MSTSTPCLKCQCGDYVPFLQDTGKCARCGHALAGHRLNVDAETARFDGSDYDPEVDNVRLTGQLLRIFEVMKDAEYRTLQEIADITGDPPASVSAQLRHLRKKRFGSHRVNKRSRGSRSSGLFEYSLELASPSE